MPIKVKAPGSCGELVQGTIEGVNFLITCPIDWYTEAQATPFSGDWAGNPKFYKDLGLAGQFDELNPKTAAAVQHTLKYLGVSKTVNLKISSDLPRGKGMASSSADISAACQAAAIAAAGRRLFPDEIADIALSIEPTDGIFYPGIIMFDHISGKIRRLLGAPPPIHIAIFDIAPQNGIIDTLQFNARKDLPALNKAKEKKTRLAAEMVMDGLAKQDISRIGGGATLSALANQEILYKPHLEKTVASAHSHGAAGVCVAHSGTVFGALFDARKIEGHDAVVTDICRLDGQIRYLKTVRLISGGLRIEGDGKADGF